MAIGVLAVVGGAIAWVIDSRTERREPEGGWELGEVDPFAGGHPVPPLPGQQAHPQPRPARPDRRGCPDRRRGGAVS
ncbi:hypothetical protein GCM10025868_31080 [Angustibacter aerolatus]|uniref:Uncharacterized protein n=1 Tax=Angustibacter aerolatus TaxID=1162965 RepID=A0ABQ6JKC1_9ACTN|nr:hypothetical protein GCM10025868_31080 [Angustibacter aerolatus]